MIRVLALVVTAVACSQPPASPESPAAVRARVGSERFQIVGAVRGLPLGVRDELQKLFGSFALDIADPGAEFQASDSIVDPSLPSRRLVAAGCSMDYCLVHYEIGGATPSWRVAFFHWTPEATRFEWGGIAARGLGSIEDVRKAILAGAIKGPIDTW